MSAMDYQFGIDQMVTQTTFVRDDKLKQYHQEFESTMTTNQLFGTKVQTDESCTHFQLHFDRGQLPPGSLIFQTVLAEFLHRKSLGNDENKTQSTMDI